MAYVDKINVQGTDYDINDKRLPKVNDVVTLDDNFTANSIVEKMSGYSFTTPFTNTLVPIYAGVCKNGNKITLVLFGKFTKVDNNPVGLCKFVIPSSVGAKLYPYSIGGESDYLDNKQVTFTQSDNPSLATTALLDCQKESNTVLVINLRYLNNLTASQEYYFRYEATFLLSDNLAA